MTARQADATAAEIRELRELRGWSQEDLARRINAGAKTISRIENGRISLTEDKAVRILATIAASVGIVRWPRPEARELAVILRALAAAGLI